MAKSPVVAIELLLFERLCERLLLYPKCATLGAIYGELLIKKRPSVPHAVSSVP